MALESTKITFNYNPKRAFVFEPVALAASQSALLLGPSGSGKTTFLHLLSGLLEPKQGAVKINGKNIFDLSVKQRDSYLGRHLGMIFQRSYFLPYLTIGENLKLAAATQNKKLSKGNIEAALDQLGVSHIAQQKPANCSVGEQQRASIARAILHQPSVILADEPTSALDDENTLKVAQLLQEVATAQNAALLIVTHDTRLKPLITKTFTL